MSPENAMAVKRRRDARVVILGAGFAGVRAAVGLAPMPGVEVALVDRSAMPAIKTRLHEMRHGVSSVPVERLLRGSAVRFVRGEVQAIDRKRRTVSVNGRTLPYDWLVIALGSRTANLGVRGARKRVIVLDSAGDARRFAATVRRLSRGPGRLAVVGAGPTGVETASEAALRLRRGRVTLIEASGRILPTFGARSSIEVGSRAHGARDLRPRFARVLALYARERLRWLGVEIRTGARVEAVADGSITLEGGERIECEAVIWTAGIEPSPLLAQAGLAPPGKAARVDRFLLSRADPRVYVTGDCAALPGAGAGRPSAQIAVQQGVFVAADIRRRLAGEPREPWHGAILGEFLSLGLWDAAGRIRVGPLEVPLVGPVAWAAKQAGVLRHLFTLARARGNLVPRGGPEARTISS
jgi:NADH dehydrogenase